MKKLLVALLIVSFAISSLAFSVSADAELQNYCLNCPVEVSGIEADAYPGENAVDGDMSTRWASDYNDDAYIIVDLGAPKAIGYLAVYWEAAYPTDFSIQTSSDGTSIEHTIATYTGNSEVNFELSFDTITARYIHIICTKRATEYGNSIYEIVARQSADATAATVAAGYPSSGLTAPSGSAIITGSLIGLEMGWGDNAAAGRDAAFDGDTSTFFDPLSVGDGYCGVDAGEAYVLTMIAIHPRDGQLPRFLGAEVDGSNDGENWDVIWVSDSEADEFTWYEIDAAEFDIAAPTYQYYRYYNEVSHGDVADVEFYGYPASTGPIVETAAPETEAPVADTEVAVETPAAQTFDVIFAASVICTAALAGVVISKKRA